MQKLRKEAQRADDGDDECDSFPDREKYQKVFTKRSSSCDTDSGHQINFAGSSQGMFYSTLFYILL